MKTLWCILINGNHVRNQGYIHKCGLFGTYKGENGWVLHHIPSGLSIGFDCNLKREVYQKIELLLLCDFIDWYQTDAKEFRHLSGSHIVNYLEGGITLTELKTAIMIDTLRRAK